MGISRLTVQDGTLPDGTFIPAGYQVSVDLLRIDRNPAVYPNPDVFDPFRFSKLRDETGSDAKYGFASVDKNVRAASSNHSAFSMTYIDTLVVFALRDRETRLVSRFNTNKLIND